MRSVWQNIFEILVGTVLSVLILAGVLYVAPEDILSPVSLGVFVFVFVFLCAFMRSK